MFGIRHFHSYLFGRHFKLQNEHKPLLTLFNEQKHVPSQASSRIQCWALKVAAYDYSIVFRSTTQHVNGDVMSRVPLEGTPVEPQTNPKLDLISKIFKMHQSQHVRLHTRQRGISSCPECVGTSGKGDRRLTT